MKKFIHNAMTICQVTSARFTKNLCGVTGGHQNIKRSALLLTLFVIASSSITTAFASTPANEIPVRRYMLSIGANNGGRDKVVLRYAVSDARAFASVLINMGGINEGDALILANPTARELLDGIQTVAAKIYAGRIEEPNARNEIFVYYSGHADAHGLKLGGETLSWTDFRNAVDGFDADVKVAVVDACGSGAITRAKGGVARPVFMSDASSNMTGYAYLTSSNENEASQESDLLRGSFFTHALLTGLRGAADMTGNGRVTISEAYQFAFNETLHSTQNTRSGTQHPNRDMNLTGTGDIVMTDLRKTSAALSLDADMDGRLFIRDERGHLFAELRKNRGRAMSLGMPPGRYTVQMELASQSWSEGSIVVTRGGTTVLTMNDLRPMGARRRTVARGGGGYMYRASSGVVGMYVADVTVFAGAQNENMLSLRAGLPWVYALFEYCSPINEIDFSSRNIGYGIGTRFGMNGAIVPNVDFVVSNIHGRQHHHHTIGGGHKWDNLPSDPAYLHLRYTARAGASYTLSRYLAVTGGVSLNMTMECDHGDAQNHSRFGSIYGNRDSQDHRFHAWPGIYLGVTVGQIRTRSGGVW